jgi:hypothetical protein
MKKKVGTIIETSQTHGVFALFVQFYPKFFQKTRRKEEVAPH